MKEDQDDRWRTLVRSLEESVFLEIMKNYLGGFKTPYNKNDLLRRLERVLQTSEFQKFLYASCQEEDWLILSIIYNFKHCQKSLLFLALRDTFSNFEIEKRLINLEERLLIFKQIDSQSLYYVSSPLLPESITKELTLSRFIQINKGTPPSPQGPPLFTGTFLTSFLSLIYEEKNILNSDGSLKKRFIKQIDDKIFSLSNKSHKNELILCLLKAFKGLNLITERDNSFELQLEPLKSFSKLDKDLQLQLFWSTLLFYQKGEEEKQDQFLSLFFHSINFDWGLKEEDIKLLFRYLWNRIDYTSQPSNSDPLFNKLCYFQFLIKKEDLYYIHPLAKSLLFSNLEVAGTLFLHATYDINLTLEAPFSLELALSSELIRYDSFSEFKLSKTSYKRFLRSGKSLEDIKKEYEGRFKTPLVQNIVFSLSDWEKEYNSLKLWDGIVLELDSNQSIIFENNQLLNPFIIKKLAKNIILLDRSRKEQWLPLLEKQDLSPLPHIRTNHRSKPYFHRSLYKEEVPRLADLNDLDAPVNPPPHQGVNNDLIKYTENLTSLSSEEKKEIIERIKRYVIFRKEQIQPGIISFQLSIAKGLEYQSKLRLIQSTIGERAFYLEITLPQGDFDLKTYQVIPYKIENNEEKTPLLIGLELPNRTFSCPIKKISLIKKVRFALF